LEVTAISAHAFTHVADHYWIMRTGASMGEGYGPVIVAKKNYRREDLRGKVVATPGRLTTANLLFKIYMDGIANIDMPFDQIIEAVLSEKVDAGLLIHEGQITYKELGLHKVVDFGEEWEKDSHGLPLPLGLDVVRKDLGEELARRLSRALQESIHYGYQHQDESIPYALEFGRGIEAGLGAKFVKMYVNEVTIDMGEAGKKALQLLFERAYEKKLIPKPPVVDLY
jgi:1,4-dihydroxy-6-naphthoate synthase